MELGEITCDVTRWCLELTSPVPYVVRLDRCGRVDQWEKRNPHLPLSGRLSVDTSERGVRTVAGIILSQMALGRVAAHRYNEVRN